MGWEVDEDERQKAQNSPGIQGSGVPPLVGRRVLSLRCTSLLFTWTWKQAVGVGKLWPPPGVYRTHGVSATSMSSGLAHLPVARGVRLAASPLHAHRKGRVRLFPHCLGPHVPSLCLCNSSSRSRVRCSSACLPDVGFPSQTVCRPQAKQ